MTKVQFEKDKSRTANLNLDLFDVNMSKGGGHAARLRDFYGQFKPADFRTAGMSQDLLYNYRDIGASTERVMAVNKSMKSDVPVGAYVVTKVQQDEQDVADVVATAIFTTEDVQSYTSRSKRAAVLSKLGIASRDTGIRYLTGMMHERDAGHAPNIINLALNAGRIAGLTEVRLLRSPETLAVSTTQIHTLEQEVDLDDPAFGFSGGNYGTAVIEGTEYSGYLFTRPLR